MPPTAERRRFVRSDHSGAAIIDSAAIVGAQRSYAISESITGLMSIMRSGPAATDCLAIVGPPEPTSRKAQRIANLANGRCRIEVFSDRIASDEEWASGTSGTDIGRLVTLVRSGQITRVLLATPVEEQQRIASVIKHLEGMDVDVDLLLDGFSTYSRFGHAMTEDVCVARILRRPLTVDPGPDQIDHRPNRRAPGCCAHGAAFAFDSSDCEAHQSWTNFFSPAAVWCQ